MPVKGVQRDFTVWFYYLTQELTCSHCHLKCFEIFKSFWGELAPCTGERPGTQPLVAHSSPRAGLIGLSSFPSEKITGLESAHFFLKHLWF